MTSPGRPAPSHPPTDPWSADAPTIGYARYGDTRTMSGPVPQRGRRTRLILGLGLVLALLAGIGAYAVASLWYGWNITEPEEVMPADAAQFVRLDLSPGLEQRLALGRIAQKFPHDGEGRDIAEQMKREFLGVDSETYDRDIRPWLGERLAAGSWSADGTSGQACTLAALAAEDSPDASLRRVQARQGAAEFGFVVLQGYALVARCEGRTDSQAAATAAANRAQTSSLAQLAAFRQGLSDLPGRPAAVAWADIALLRAIQAGDGPAVVAGVTLPAAAQLGQFVAGLEAVDGGLDLNFRIGGAGAPQATVDVSGRLGALPDNTAIGIASDLQASPVATEIGKSVANSLSSGAFSALAAGVFQALGSVLTIAANAPTGDNYPWRLAAETTSTEKALALAVAFGLPGLFAGISVKTDGNVMTATSRGYQGSAGRLADSPVYAEAMGAIDARTVVAAYVDVARLMPSLRLTPPEAARLKPIQAAGLLVGDDGGTVAGRLRVLIP